MQNTAQLDEIWNALLNKVEGQLTPSTYQALLTAARPMLLEENKLTVGVTSNFYSNFLSQKCGALLEEALRQLLDNASLRLHIAVSPTPELVEIETPEASPIIAPPPRETSKNAPFLNPRYTFTTFVVGQGNRFAHAAAKAVAEAPGKSYNPLFLYGGVGLGKTHLIQAVAAQILAGAPDTRVTYVTSEAFTNDLINSIRDDRTEPFRQLYRNSAVLMIDDIQFIAGKERTQEEFFHTFNALYESTRQIIITSDRPPKDIPTLEERLRSRFESGLIADIQPPDFETRMAILKKKAEVAEFSVPDEVLALIAERITANIRELEGALIRIAAYASLNERDISLEMADSVLHDIVGRHADRRGLSIDLIKKVTAEYYSIKIDDMNAKIRTREIATARQVAMYLSREMTSASLPKIGEEFGGRDHTTVMHAHEKVRTNVRSDRDIREAVETITNNLKRYA